MARPGADAPFVPNGESRRETAILLVGTADEFGISQDSIRATASGFFITEELADVLYDDGVDQKDDTAEDSGEYNPADHTVAEVKEHVSENPDDAEAVLAAEREGKDRSSLVEWLTDHNASGNRAGKNNEE